MSDKFNKASIIIDDGGSAVDKGRNVNSNVD